MGIALRGLLPLFFIALGGTVAAQSRVMADVTARQVHKGKSMRVEKQVFYSSNGNLVVHYTYPQQYYMVTNRLGETSVYQPKAGEVMLVNDRSMSSESELLTIFMSPSYADLGLTRLGFVLAKVEKDGADKVMTYTPTHVDDKAFSRAVVVLREGNPIYCAFYDQSGNVVKKTYYSHYGELPMITFPTLVTQISYDGRGDSIIRREEYRNVRTKDFPKDALFDYKVPADARRVTPFGK